MPRSSNSGILVQDYEITYRTCVAIFVVVLAGVSMTHLRSTTWELRHQAVRRSERRDRSQETQPNGCRHEWSALFDTFSRSLFPLIDLETERKLSRSTALHLTNRFPRCANLRRDDLLPVYRKHAPTTRRPHG
ncbi:hypothetical protein GQ600_7522 [Phytophthora cactorum]|nr:hypothetical protein GQ600_7522 [Phytophthora cactorum]